MAGTGPGDLFALADELLTACIESLDTIPLLAPGLGGAPERAFVSPGQPSDDCCEQLTVYPALVSSDPVQPLKNQERQNIVTLVARITRCVPTEPVIPPAEELQAIAEQIDADGWALWNHLFGLVRSGELFTLCGPVLWDGMRSVGPQGGCGGWQLVLRVRLEGY